MHLAYFDETGTDGHSPVAMFGALIVPTGKFGRLSALHDTAIQQVIPYDRRNQFDEFHASELYKGGGIFKEIDEERRFTAIRVLLGTLRMEDLTFVYSAIDRKEVANSPFGIAKPIHAAFHMCLLGVEDWATARHPRHGDAVGGAKLIDWNDTFLCILDDCSDRELKKEYKTTYRRLRNKYPFANVAENRLWHAHDDMFFADSADCLGVQVADLCNYFVRMHIEAIPEPQNFYRLISERVICAKPEPEWSQFKRMFRDDKGLGYGENTRVSEVRPDNADNTSRRSEGSKSSNGSGETSKRGEAEGQE